MAGFTPVTFGGENVTPKNDGGLYQAHYGDGILWGCGMSLTGSPYTDLTISAGEMIIGGRVIFVDGATDINLEGLAGTTNYVQIKGVITLGNTPVFDTVLVEANTPSFGPLTQEDINDNGTTYEVELAVVQASSGTPTAIYSTMRKSGLVAGGNIILPRTLTNDARINLTDTGGVLNIGKFVSGSAVGGIQSDTTDATIVYGENGVYLRPNGQGDSTGQMSIGTDGSISVGGQITGGHPNTPRTPTGGATLTSSMSTITSYSTGIITGGVYLVTAECDYTPASATAHYPQLEIQNSIKNTYYTATAGGRHFLISGIVTGVSSIVFRGTTGTGSTNATVNNIVINIVRLS